MTRSRGWAWRAMLSALAGGGLTAAGLGGPLAGGALAADAPMSSPSPSEGSTAPTPRRHPRDHPPPRRAPRKPPTQPANTSTDQHPAAEHARQPRDRNTRARRVVEVPTVVVQRQRRQKTTPSKNAKNPSLTATHGPALEQPAGDERRQQGPTTASGPNGVAAVAAARGRAGRRARGGARHLGGLRAGARLLPDPAVPAADLPGGRGPVRRAVADPRGDQRSRDQLRHATSRSPRPARWAGCSSCLRPGCSTGWTPSTPATPTPTTRSTRSSPPRATCTPPAPPSNLRTAILAYNHSEAYADSVLLRAKLISSYPKSVIATLTGLVDARLPVTGKQVSWGPLLPAARVAVERDRERQGRRRRGEDRIERCKHSGGRLAAQQRLTPRRRIGAGLGARTVAHCGGVRRRQRRRSGQLRLRSSWT